MKDPFRALSDMKGSFMASSRWLAMKGSREVAAGHRGGDPPGDCSGRDKELEQLDAFIEAAAVSGGGLLLTGDAGVGKSVLLDAAMARATATGARVVRAAGVEFEAGMSFAGLHQVVHPLAEDLRRLGDRYRRALAVATGLDDGVPADQLTVSNALLALLTEASQVGCTRPRTGRKYLSLSNTGICATNASYSPEKLPETRTAALTCVNAAVECCSPDGI